MTARALACILAAGWLLAPAAAWADGFMSPRIVELGIGRSAKMVASPRQEAVLATDGQSVQVILRTHFRAGPEELAWVVPVPAKPTNIDKCDERIFTVLDEGTAPRFRRFVGGGGGFGCGCGAAAGSADLGPAVVVEETGTAGIFQYVVLSAKRADELTKWLNKNKYYVPIGAERIFERYVQAGWHWLAMRVRPEESDKPTLAPHPVTYTYRDTKLTYPLVISQLSADLTNEIVLYVIGRGRYAAANWANATTTDVTDDLESLRTDAEAASGTNYEKLFQAAAEAEAGRLFVTEYCQGLAHFRNRSDSRDLVSGWLDRGLAQAMPAGATLTRLRAIMTPKAMDRDVTLVPVAWGEVENIHHLARAGEARPPAVAFIVPVAALGALCLGVCLTKMTGWPRAGGIACIVLGAAAMAMM